MTVTPIVPSWARAAIVADLREDVSDIQTDYFASRSTRRVLLGWSKHERDLFSEMRKAASTFSETEHLGPGKDRYQPRVVLTVDAPSIGRWRGQWSPWHSQLDDHGGFTFRTRAEADAFIAERGAPADMTVDGVHVTFAWSVERSSVEHREKYSMGSGYYLADDRYSGWRVSKTSVADVSRGL